MVIAIAVISADASDHSGWQMTMPLPLQTMRSRQKNVPVLELIPCQG